MSTPESPAVGEGRPTGPARPARTAYLATHYPALSHSFILREVQAVRREGVDVSTYTVRRSPRADMRTDAMIAEDQATPALLGAGAREWLGAHARLVRRSPRALLGSIGRAARSGPPTPKGKVWQLIYLAESVVLHDRLQREGIHHIHSHHANGAADVARLTADLGNRVDGDGTWSWSLTMHGSTEFDDVKLHDLPAKARDAAAISAISDYCRAQVIRHLPPDTWDKVSIARMSVDAATFGPPATPREHDGPLRVVTVGRLHPVKGFPILGDAVADLRDQGVDVELRIVGQGDLEDALRAQIRERGVGDRVTLTGPLGEAAIVEQLHWADAYVCSSFTEGLPVVLMESMATECATISTHIAAVPELITDGVSGLIVAPGRVDELADALRRLAEDPALRRSLGAAGREAVLREFTTDTAGPAKATFLKDVAGPVS